MKKTLYALFLVCLALIVLPFFAMAEGGETGSLTFTVDISVEDADREIYNEYCAAYNNGTLTDDHALRYELELYKTTSGSTEHISDGTHGGFVFTNGRTETIRIPYKQDGQYTVTLEDLPAGYEYNLICLYTSEFVETSSSSSVFGKIPSGGTETVSLAFDFEPENRLSLRLDSAMNGTNLPQEFTYTVTLGDTSFNGTYSDGTYGDVTFTNGVATFTLPITFLDSIEFSGLPNCSYQITQAAKEGFTTDIAGASGNICIGSTAVCSFRNTPISIMFSVQNTLDSGLENDKNLSFNYYLDVHDPAINGDYGNLYFENGVADFNVQANHERERSVILMQGKSFTITPEAREGFTVAPAFQTGTFGDSSSTFAFTHTRSSNDILTVNTRLVSDLSADADQAFNYTVTLDNATISGAYGDLTFANGVAAFTLKGGESKGIDVSKLIGIGYTIEQKEAEGFTTTPDEHTGTFTSNHSPITFTNTRLTGNLTVSNTVTGAPASQADRDFTYTVTLGDTSISGTYGDMTFTNGVASFTLKGGVSKTALNLPATLTYTVAQTAAEGFTTMQLGETGAISPKTNVVALFTNTRKSGRLTVSNVLESDILEDAFKRFDYTVTLGDTSISGEYGDMTFTNGVATFTLKDGETVTATGLPATLGYTVTQNADLSFTTAPDGFSYTGAITAGETTAAFTNTRKTGGNVIVTNRVESPLANDRNKIFTFEIALTLNGSPIGNKQISLTHGQSETITGLPLGADIQVTQKSQHPGFPNQPQKTFQGTLTYGDFVAAFDNIRETGSLKISQQVISDLAADKDVDFAYTLTVSKDAAAGEPAKDLEILPFNEGVTSFSLRGNENLTISGLPAGYYYTLEQEEQTGFGLSAEKTSGLIKANEQAEAVLTNTRARSALQVELRVASPLDGDKATAFPFTVTLEDKNINGEYGGMTFEKGVARFNLKHGEKLLGDGLPISAAYQVTVDAGEDFDVTGENDADRIDTGLTQTLMTLKRRTGDLTVTNTVVSDLAGDKNKEFSFMVELDDPTISGAYGDMTFGQAGLAVFSLKHGESAIASGLPLGVGYTVEAAEEEGFAITASGDSGVISDNTAPAEFTHTRLILAHPITAATGQGGRILLNKTAAKPGERVQFTLQADANYRFANAKVTFGDEAVTVTGPDEKGVCTFVMPNGAVQVEAAFQYVPAAPATGDEASLILWTALLALGAAGCLMLRRRSFR